MKYEEDPLFTVNLLNKIQELEKILWLVINAMNGEARISLFDIENFDPKNCYVDNAYDSASYKKVYRALVRRKQ